MAGCFGNNSYDRYLERQLDDYLNQYDDDMEFCSCEKELSYWAEDSEHKVVLYDVKIHGKFSHEHINLGKPIVEYVAYFYDDMDCYEEDTDYKCCPECNLPIEEDLADLEDSFGSTIQAIPTSSITE